MTAERLREIFDALFTRRIVIQLRADLEEARRERDYFRARADRLELMLLGRPSAARERKPMEMPTAINPFAGTRFGQLVKERQEKIKAEEERAKQEQPETVKGAN